MIKNKLKRTIRNIINFFIPNNKLRKKINYFFSEKYILDKLDLEEYQKSELLKFNSKYKFEDKIVLEIGSDLKLKTANAIIKLGAKKVYAVNPQFSNDITSSNKRIIPIKNLFENTDFMDTKFDIIFGIALLEHIKQPQQLARECYTVLKSDGIGYLSGCPIWTCASGHHVYCINETGKCYFFNKKDCPIPAWSHLVLNKEKMKTLLQQTKNISNQDSIMITNMIFGDEMSKLSADEIIVAFQSISGLNINYKKNIDQNLPSKNEYYYKALEKYTKEDLAISGLEIYFSKK